MPTILSEKPGKLAKPKVAFRQTITFTTPQATYLRKSAKGLGISVSDLVRRIIDEYRGK